MTAPAFTFQEVVSFAELRSLAGAAGPCVTVAMPFPSPLEVRTRMKNALQGIEKRLSDSDPDQTAVTLIGPVRDLATAIETNGTWAKALVVLRSPGVFQGYWLRDWRREIVDVGRHFQLRPLLAAMAREQRFHLLGLSQNHVRLFSGTMFHGDEVKLPPSTPQDIRVWLKTRIPDHVLDNRSTGGPSTGSMKGVLFGTSTDREKHDEYLRHFFLEVAHGVHALLRDDPTPLMLAGVEDDLAIYRRSNTYPNLFGRDIQGSPDGLAGPHLIERAQDLLSRSQSEPLRKALSDLERRHITSDAKEIAGMARDGRVDDLLIDEGAEGDWVEAAALAVLRQGGRTFAIRAEEMPRSAPAVAVLRY